MLKLNSPVRNHNNIVQMFQSCKESSAVHTHRTLTEDAYDG